MKPFKSADEVLARAVDLLSRREHGTVELRRKLRTKGAPGQWIDEVLERLEDNGLVDDERAAFELARWYSLGGQRGPRKVDQLLVQRGFSAAQRSEAIGRAREALGLDERACADELLRSRFPDAMERGLTARDRARARRFLLGKGYDARVVHGALDACPRLREDEGGNGPDEEDWE